MTKKPVLFWGARGQARVLGEALTGTAYRPAAYLDIDPQVVPPDASLPLLRNLREVKAWRQALRCKGRPYAVLAMGGKRGRERVRLMEQLFALGFRSLTVRHAQAWVARDAKIGEGCQILAGARICAGAHLGRQSIINTGVIVEHDCRLGEGVHLAPGVKLAGEVWVGDGAFLGIGAVVLPRCRIGNDAVVGAGAVVTRNVRPGSTVVGCPARLLRRKKKRGACRRG